MQKFILIPPMHPPDTVQDLAVRRDPHEHVRQEDVVQVRFPLVLEEQIRHPHLLRIHKDEVLHLPCAIESILL